MVGMQWRRGVSDADPLLKGIDFIECASIDDIMLYTLPEGTPRALTTPVPATQVAVNQGEAGGEVVYRRCGAGTMLDSMVIPRLELSPHRVGALSITSGTDTLEVPLGLCRPIIPNCTATSPAEWEACISAELTYVNMWQNPNMPGSTSFFRSIGNAFQSFGNVFVDISSTIGRTILSGFTSLPSMIIDTTIGGIGMLTGQQPQQAASPDLVTANARIGCAPENGQQRLAGTHQGIVGIQMSTNGGTERGEVTNITVECGTVTRTPPVAAYPSAEAVGSIVVSGTPLNLGVVMDVNIGADAEGKGGVKVWVFVVVGVLLLIIVVVVIVLVVKQHKKSKAASITAPSNSAASNSAPIKPSNSAAIKPSNSAPIKPSISAAINSAPSNSALQTL